MRTQGRHRTNVTPSYFIFKLVFTIESFIDMDSAVECAGETQGQSLQSPSNFHPSRNYVFPVRMFESKGEKRSF